LWEGGREGRRDLRDLEKFTDIPLQVGFG